MVPIAFNLKCRSKIVNFIRRLITALTYLNLGKKCANHSPVYQHDCYEGSLHVLPSSVNVPSYQSSWHLARSVQVHLQTSLTTRHQTSRHHCSLPTPILWRAAFFSCEFHKHIHWGCQDCMTCWPRVPHQQKLSRKWTQPHDFLSRKRGKLVATSLTHSEKSYTEDICTHLC